MVFDYQCVMRVAVASSRWREYLAIAHYATNCLSTVSAVYLSFYGLFLVICKTTKGHTSSEYKGLFSIA